MPGCLDAWICWSKMFNSTFWNFLAIRLVPYSNLSHSLFNPHLSSLVPLKILLVECKKHCFGMQNTRDLFFAEKSTGRAALHRISEWGGPMQASVLHGSIFRKWTHAPMQAADPCTHARRRLAWVHFPKIIRKFG